LTDNRPFKSAEFSFDYANLGQTQQFSGVGAQHQNRVERASQTIINWSRAMLLHHVLHSPQEDRLLLWPFAVDYAVWIWNHLPDFSTRLSPIEVFTKSSFPDSHHLQRVRVFGCPVHVLQPTLQDAKKLPKWQKNRGRIFFWDFRPITAPVSPWSLILKQEVLQPSIMSSLMKSFLPQSRALLMIRLRQPLIYGTTSGTTATTNIRAFWIHAMPRYHLMPTLSPTVTTNSEVQTETFGLVDEIDKGRTC
jgi:hypothetical protein